MKKRPTGCSTLNSVPVLVRDVTGPLGPTPASGLGMPPEAGGSPGGSAGVTAPVYQSRAIPALDFDFDLTVNVNRAVDGPLGASETIRAALN